MLNKIAEKVISSYFGKFIEGVDQSKMNVSLLGGSAAIEDIALQKDYFNSLHMPFRLLYSSIGSLLMNIPYTKLASSSVDIRLKNVVIVFQQTEPGEWKFDSEYLRLKKRELVASYVRKLLESLERGGDQPGLMSRLLGKVADNLHFNLSGLHVRVEGADFAFGLTLNELNLCTTNENWEQIFVQRSKDKDLFKLLRLNEICLYWEPQPAERFATMEPTKVKQRMLELIGKTDNKILQISASCKLINHAETKITEPLHLLKVQLDKIEFALEKDQLRQVMSLVAVLSLYSDQAFSSKVRRVQIEQEDYRDEYEEEFKNFVVGVCRGRKEELSQKIDYLASNIEYSQLYAWCRDIVKEYCRNERLQKMYETKNKKGWFSRKGPEVELTQEEKEEVERLLEQTFASEATPSERPSSAPKFALEVRLEGSCLKLIDQHDFMEFELSRIDFNLRKSGDSSLFALGLSVGGLAVSLSDCQSGILDFDKQAESLLVLRYENVVAEECNTRLELSIAQFRLMFNKQFNRRLVDFFSVKADQRVKSKTLHQFERMKLPREKKGPVLKRWYNTQISIHSPFILIPASELADGQFLQLRLGDFTVLSERGRQDSTQIFGCSISQFSAEFIPSISEFRYKGTVLEPDPILRRTDLALRLTVYKDPSDGQPQWELNSELKQIKVQLNEQNMGRLAKLLHVLSDKEAYLRRLQARKEEVLSRKVREGTLQLEEQDYWAVLSGPYLYLYHEGRELQPVCQFFVKDSQVSRAEGGFGFVNKYHNASFISEEAEAWCQSLQAEVQKYRTHDSVVDEPAPESRQTSKVIALVAEHIELSVPKLKMTVEGLSARWQASKEHKRLELKSQGLRVSDTVFQFSKKEWNQFVAVSQSGTGPGLSLLLSRREGQSTDTALAIGKINVNWKPDVILELVAVLKSLKPASFSRVREEDMRAEQLQPQEVIAGVKSAKRHLDRERAIEGSKLIGRKVEHCLASTQAYSEVLGRPFKQNYQFRLDLGKAEFLFFHRQSHLWQFQAAGQALRVEVKGGPDGLFVRGSFGDLRVFQTTNYPDTVDSSQHPQLIQPNLILGRVEPVEKLIEFTFSQPSKFLTRDRASGLLAVFLRPVRFVYYNQVTLRLVDYLLIQVLMLILTPQLVTANEGLIEQLRRNQHSDLKPILIWDQLANIVQRCLSPSFMMQRIQLEAPVLCIKPRFDSDHELELRADLLRITNSQCKSAGRVVSAEQEEFSQLWEEDHLVHIEGASVFCNKEGRSKERSLSFSLECNIVRVLNEAEMEIICPQTVYDRTLQINLKIPRLQAQVDRLQYLLILRTLGYNVLFDDMKDCLFIHNYQVTKIMRPRPIKFGMRLQRLQLFFEKEHQIFCEVGCSPFQIKFQRSHLLASEMKFQFFNGEMLCHRLSEEIPVFVGTKPICIAIRSRPGEGAKYDISIQEPRILVDLDTFIKLGSYAQIQGRISPAPPQVVGQLQLTIVASKCQVVVEQHREKEERLVRSFIAVMNLGYSLKREAHTSLQFHRGQLSKGRESYRAVKQKTVSEQKVMLNFQLFRTDYPGFRKFQLERLSRRYISTSSDFIFGEKSSIGLAQDMLLQVYKERKIRADFFNFKLSISDLKLLQQIFAYQKRRVVRVQGPSSAVPAVQQPPFASLQVSMQKLQLTLVSRFQAYEVPIFTVQLLQTGLNLVQTKSCSLANIQSSITANYNNLETAVWQPVVEHASIKLTHVSKHQKGNSLILEGQLSQVVLVVSPQLLASVKLFQQQMEKGSIRDEISYGEGTIEQVTNFCFSNQTGYQILIVKSQHSPQQVVASGSSVSLSIKGQLVQQLVLLHSLKKYRLTLPERLPSQMQFLHFSDEEGVASPYVLAYSLVIQQGKQVLRLASQLRVKNRSNRVFRAKVQRYGSPSLDLTVLPSEAGYLPFDYNNCKLMFSEPQFATFDFGKSKQLSQQQSHFFYLRMENSLIINFKREIVNLTPTVLRAGAHSIPPGGRGYHLFECRLNDKPWNSPPYQVVTKGHRSFVSVGFYVLDYTNELLVFNANTCKPVELVVEGKGESPSIFYLPGECAGIYLELVKGRRKKLFGKQRTVDIPFEGARSTVVLSNSEAQLSAQFTILGYMKTYTQADGLSTKVIEVKHCCHIANQTALTLLYKPLPDMHPEQVDSGIRAPVAYFSPQRKARLVLKNPITREEFALSGDISLDGILNFCTLLFRSESGSVKYVNYALVEQDNCVFLLFEQVIEVERALLLIENRVSEIQLTIVEKSLLTINLPRDKVRQLRQCCQPGARVPFGYEFPFLSREQKGLVVGFQVNCSMIEGSAKPLDINLDDLPCSRQIGVSKDGRVVMECQLQVELVGGSKVLVLKKKTAESQQIVDVHQTINIHELGLSVVGANRGVRQELAYLHLDGISLQRIARPESQLLKFRMDSLSIDNCNVRSEFKTIASAASRPVVQFQLQSAKGLVGLLKLAVSEIVINLTSNTVMAISQTVSICTSTLKAEENAVPLLNYDKALIDLGSLLYLKEVRVPVIRLLVNYKKDSDLGKYNFLSVISLEDCQITLPQITLKQVQVQRYSQLGARLKDFYKNGLKTALIPVIGQLPLFGNVYSFLSGISDGARQISEGSNNGRSNSLLSGTKKLAGNTVGGIFGIVSSVTGSLGDGIKEATQKIDKTPARKQKQKPKGTFEGLGMGFVSFFKGVGDGVAGLATRPYERARDEGVSGFFVGLGQGVSGLLLKPLGGVLDLAFNATEGIKADFVTNKELSHFKYFQRKRLPRSFYSQSRSLNYYNLLHAKLTSEILVALEELPAVSLVEVFQYWALDFKGHFVIATEGLFDVGKEVRLIQYKNVQKTTLEGEDRILLKLRDRPTVAYSMRAPASFKAQLLGRASLI